MINIWTDKSLITKDCDFFEDCDSFVNSFVSSTEFSDRDFSAIRIIDGAVVTDINLGEVKTPYGLTNIENLSSGCKTVLTYLHILKKKDMASNRAVINITESGVNALNVLFDFADEDSRSDIVFYLGYVNKLSDCVQKDYLVNNSDMVSNLALVGGCGNEGL